jgi:formate dehydrogenase maturation protein FdhE
MHLDPHIAIAVVTALGAAWLMVTAGLQKSALEKRTRRRVCPSCGREIQARVCSSCAA